MSGALNIAIAGGGIAGLASAILLARRGHEITLYDKAPQPLPVGSGLIMQPSSFAVMQRLGIFDEIETKGQRLERLAGRVLPSGKMVLDVSYSALREDAFGIGIQRDILYTALLQQAIAAKVDICFSAQIMAYEQDGPEGVVLFADGTRKGGYDLVINALGAQSPLTPKQRRPLEFGALWANLPVPKEGWFMADGLEQRYFKAEKMAGMLPTGKNSNGQQTVAFFWSLQHKDYAKWRATPLADWKREVIALWPQLATSLDALETHDDLIMAKYFHRTLFQPVAQSLVAIGDSWHAASPQLGQGANMALIDAAALDASLASAATMRKGLARFYRQRRLHVYSYQIISWLFTPFYQSTGNFLPLLRDKIAAPLSRLKLAQKLLAAMVAGVLMKGR
jgi:2-polyprenyl-6-methoxyphenol hydroxylase-like FAD-dependent oxidoreductase